MSKSPQLILSNDISKIIQLFFTKAIFTVGPNSWVPFWACLGVGPLSYKIFSHASHDKMHIFCNALSASTQTTKVSKSYERLVLYIKKEFAFFADHYNPFPAIAKVETGSNMTSWNNHVSQHATQGVDSFHTRYRLSVRLKRAPAIFKRTRDQFFQARKQLSYFTKCSKLQKKTHVSKTM